MAPKPKKEPKATSGYSTRKITASGSSSKVTNKVLKPGSMAGNSKMVTPKPKAKASTSYSPKPMGLYEQGQTSRAAAKKQADKVIAKRLNATKYSPAPMTDKQKKAAALKGAKKQASIGIKKDLTKIAGTAGKVAGGVVNRVKTVAREVGDVKKAVKNVAKSGASALNLDRTGNQYLGKQAVKATAKDLKKQLKEVGSAVKSGKSGTKTGNISYNSDTQTPQGLKAKPRPKYGNSGKLPYKSGAKAEDRWKR